MLKKIQGGPLRPDPAFAFCQAPFLMTFATGGIPYAGSQQPSWPQFCSPQDPPTPIIPPRALLSFTYFLPLEEFAVLPVS